MRRFFSIFSILVLLFGIFIKTFPPVAIAENGEEPSQVWVDDDWSGYEDGQVIDDDKTFGLNAFANVQDAIDNVSPNGTVNVNSGIYAEPEILISSSLNLTGQGESSQIRGTLNLIDTQDVTIQYLDLSAETTALSLVDSGNIIITNNQIHDSEIGLDVFDSSLTVYDNTFRDNYSDVEDDGEYEYDNGERGNFWDAYTGEDSDGNGIGDTPHYLDDDSLDNYPLTDSYRDEVPPSSPGTPSTSPNPTSDLTQVWKWAASNDDYSGVLGYSHSITGSSVLDWTWIGDVLEYTTNLPEGTYQFSVRAEDNSGNISDPATSSSLTVDTTAPEIVSLKTQDTDNNGYLDAIKITFSEKIDDSRLAEGEADGWDVEGYTDEQITTGDEANDSILVLLFAEGDSPDTSARPTVTYTPSGEGSPASTHDLAGNELGNFSGSPTDAAAPVLISALTQDAIVNGRLDAIAVTFSEDIHGSSSSPADYAISDGYTIKEDPEVRGVVTLVLNEKDVVNDTGTTPEVTVRDHGVRDLADNRNWNIGPQTVTAADGAAPVSNFTSPASDSFHNQPITLAGSSSDSNGLDEPRTVNAVELFYRIDSESDWVLISTFFNESYTEPFNFEISWTPPTDGSYDFKAQATDTAGNTETTAYLNNVVYDTTPPQVSWQTPTADATLIGLVNLDTAATDELSGIATGPNYFYRPAETDDPLTSITSPWNTSAPLLLGYYDLVAQFTDQAGNSGSATIRVGVAAVTTQQSTYTAGFREIYISWQTDRSTTARVVYDTVSHPAIDPGHINYGYAFSTPIFDTDPKTTSHSTLLTGLNPFTVYYFRLISAGSPKNISPEIGAQTFSVPGGSVPAPSSGMSPAGPATIDFTSPILGISTLPFVPATSITQTESPTPTQTPSSEPDVRGVTTQTPSPTPAATAQPSLLWRYWWLLALAAGAGLIFYFRRRSA